eukprot:5625770-Amphidinium_carterae.1
MVCGLASDVSGTKDRWTTEGARFGKTGATCTSANTDHHVKQLYLLLPHQTELYITSLLLEIQIGMETQTLSQAFRPDNLLLALLVTATATNSAEVR